MKALIVCTAALVLITTGEALALQGSSHLECVNGDHVLTLSGWLYEDSDWEITGLYFRRMTIGDCEPDVILPDSALPFEPQGDGVDEYATYSAILTVTPPRTDVTYRYVPFAVRADGSEERILANCDGDFRSYSLSVCDGAPFHRGRAEFSFYCDGGDYCVEIVPCEAECWSEYFWDKIPIERMPDLWAGPEEFQWGMVVDLYGDRTHCGMPGQADYDIVRIESAPDGACGPVPVEPSSWGSFKARYR